MMRGKFAKTNPWKRWECDACYTVYKDYFLNKRGGFCSECGNDSFSEVDRGEPVLEAR